MEQKSVVVDVTSLAKREEHPPIIGAPMTDCVIEGVNTSSETITILSYLGYRPLVTVTMSSRFAFNFIMDKANRKKILCWNPSDIESSRLSSYVKGLLLKRPRSEDIKDTDRNAAKEYLKDD